MLSGLLWLAGAGRTSNALHIYLDGLSGYNGQIILGHSEASLSAIPEPGTAALLGLGLVVLARRRRRR